MTRHKFENVPENGCSIQIGSYANEHRCFLRVPRVDSSVISVLGREKNQEEGYIKRARQGYRLEVDRRRHPPTRANRSSRTNEQRGRRLISLYNFWTRSLLLSAVSKSLAVRH